MRAFALLAAFVLLALPTASSATWTIVAIDRSTGEVGSAGASCTPYVAGVVKLVPGKGAIVAQAASNMQAKADGATMLERGLDAAAIVARISSSDYDSDAAEQQYGIVSFSGKPGRSAAAFTGERTARERGQRIGKDVTVQGNILVSQSVLDATFAAFQNARSAPLGERLLLALEAGSRMGGDARCPGKTAQSAYLGVASLRNSPNELATRIVVSTHADDRQNPVAIVRAKFAAGVK